MTAVDTRPVIAAPAPRRRGRVARQPLPPLPVWRWILSIVWLLVTVLALWSAAYISFISGLQHTRVQHELYATFRGQAAQAFVPFGGVIKPGMAVAVISIPKADLKDEVIVEGTSSAQLRSGPGHLRSTAMPGQPGVSVLYGRSVAYGGPFKNIPSLKAGQKISVTTGQGQFSYLVTDVRRQGDLIPALPTGGSRLTLATSQASGWRSGWAPNEAVFVDATLQGDSQPAPGGRLTTVASTDGLMGRQSGPLTTMSLVLWLQLLVVVGCAIAWAQARWGRLQTWLVGAPIFLAVLWGTSNTAILLLPNVF